MNAITLLLILPLAQVGSNSRDAREATYSDRQMAAVQDAAAIRDGAERHRELGRVFQEIERAGDPEAIRKAVGFLGERARRIDPRGFKDLLEAFDRLDGSNQGGEAILEAANLYYASREGRARIYARAISTGEEPLGKVERLDRRQAMKLCAIEGFGGMRTLVTQYYSSLDENQRKHWLPFDWLIATMELRDGAENDEDGFRRAAKRLSEMSAEDLASRADRDEGFRRAVLETATGACEDRSSNACEQMRAVVKAQASAISDDRRRRREARKRGEEAEEYPVIEARAEWLGRVGPLVR
jgi:hypothetical protein